ncbi:hypothetical protein ASG52_24275 [Methylobacterium sp. Leaf456]|nr:hypothetical protein ASG52_24275 [Methylobacterium sp. Leaf456]
MPYGQMDDIPAILGAVELERMLRIARSESAPQTDLVSVVMPVFNRETIVGEALRSVLDQTYRNFELLIVDDGSTDGSADVAKSFDDPRIRLIELPQNGGVSAARNAGLRAASGLFVAYLDSDNIWSPHYLACMLDAFRTAPEATTAYAGQEVWEYLPHLDCDEFRFLRAAPFNRSRLERRNFIDLNVFMHRRGCYNELGGFDESMRRLVDWELILRYTACRPPVFLPVTLCRYRIARADNQITFVEDYVSNLARLRLRMRLPDLRDADDAPVTPLAVFVHARDAAAFARWRQANRAVVANYRHLAAAWPQGSEGAAGVGPDGEATAFPSVSAALAAHCDGLRASSLLLVNAEYVLSGRWKQVYAAAAREGHFDVLTGRLYTAEISTQENSLPEDLTPSQIEQYIEISSFSYRMHGNLARKAPYHCLVFTPESVKKLQLSAACSQTIQTCLSIFFGTHDGHRQVLYSPEVSASLIMS